jgi:hypothetical protein
MGKISGAVDWYGSSYLFGACFFLGAATLPIYSVYSGLLMIISSTAYVANVALPIFQKLRENWAKAQARKAYLEKNISQLKDWTVELISLDSHSEEVDLWTKDPVKAYEAKLDQAVARAERSLDMQSLFNKFNILSVKIKRYNLDFKTSIEADFRTSDFDLLKERLGKIGEQMICEKSIDSSQKMRENILEIVQKMKQKLDLNYKKRILIDQIKKERKRIKKFCVSNFKMYSEKSL